MLCGVCIFNKFIFMLMTVDEKKKTCNMLMTVDWKNARMNIGIVNLCKGEKMSKLNIDQQTIKELFENKKSDFLIPDYQMHGEK